MSFAIKENNYLGRGIGLDSNLTISEETIKGKFSVINPNYKNSDKTVNANIQTLETDNFKTAGYKTNKTGLDLVLFLNIRMMLFWVLAKIHFMKKLKLIVRSTRQKSQEGNYWDTFINLSLIMINVIKNLKLQMDLEVSIL